MIELKKSEDQYKVLLKNIFYNKYLAINHDENSQEKAKN